MLFSGITFYLKKTNRKSVIIFYEIQLFSLTRQAIKYLIEIERYDYILPESLISINKNVEKITNFPKNNETIKDNLIKINQ